MSITIHGAGCALVDYLYRDVDFASEPVTRLLRRQAGDGGLTIGGLVFADALEAFAGRDIKDILRSIVGDRAPDRENVGGPAIVSLINTAQLCPEATVRFFGAVGTDEAGSSLRTLAGKTPLDVSHLQVREGSTAATYVLSDPDYAEGHGERMFVNLLGVAARITPEHLGPDFARADIVQLGGTALVPQLHEALPRILGEARRADAMTIVNTVYDFRAESENPGALWKLGGEGAYPLVDLLITDAEEAVRLSGQEHPRDAIEWFLRRGVGAAVVTNGPEPVWFAAGKGRFAPLDPTSRPVFGEFARSPEVRAAGGDTTGCGDNFAGGLVAGIARRLEERRAAGDTVDLDSAVRLGIASGAFCLTHLGGTFVEQHAGEKQRAIHDVKLRYEATLGESR